MENSKKVIIDKIRKNKPAPTPLPEIPDFALPKQNLVDLFAETLVKVGGKILTDIKIEDVSTEIKGIYPAAQHVWSAEPAVLESTVSVDQDPHQLEILDLAIIKGEFGVAENAAIWISEDAVPQRVTPFITQHLVILLNKNQLVWNMHQAYARLGNLLPGYSVFISGPSKTADIEQSLVVGAQGPKSLTVVLL